MMAEDTDSEIPAELIEQQLRFLRDEGPPVDLTGLTAEAFTAASHVLGVIEALVNAGPKPPRLANDPVAIRLGLVSPPTGEPLPATMDPGDPVTASVLEIERRFFISASPAATDGTEFERRFECRSLVEYVLVVVVPESTGAAALASHARSAFALSHDLSAVAYTIADATASLLLTYSECHNMLEPETGWVTAPAGLTSDPLGVVLGRYLERSDPRWEDVEELAVTDSLEALDDDVVDVVDLVMQELAASSPRLDHKKRARAFVLDQERDVFVGWAQSIQRERTTIDEVLADIHVRAGES